jgi:predicted NAD-dependent protein-ADP-ribosyltransferase YbiA (DUF1768 family)
MVKSKIDPKNIDYKEEKELEDDDEYHASIRYNYTLYKMKIEIVLGKIRYTYSKYDVVFYPIYLVFGDEIDSKIGVFEIEANKAIEAVDADGDIDLRKGNIIPFVSEAYLKKQIADYEKETKFQESQQQKPEESDVDAIEKGKQAEDQEPVLDEVTMTKPVPIDDIFSLKIPEGQNKNAKTDETLKDGIFTDNETVAMLPMLPKESSADSDKIKSEYTASPSNDWIEDFANNNNYKIIDNEGEGDCFFAVIRDAYKQIGKDTTVEKLRALLSKNASEEKFNHYRSLYLMFTDEIANVDKELADIKKNGALLKKRISKAETAEIHKKLMDEAKETLKRKDDLTSDRANALTNLHEFRHMKEIDSFEKFKEFILSHNYWADDWAISTLEHLLNMKVIILSEGDYDEDDKDSVIWSTASSIMRCELSNDTNGEKFRPDYYIMTSYTGQHYKLITYKNKKIFKFQEIPYDVKVLIINKCMERNSGIYFLIDDFCKMKTELGLPSDCGKPKSDEDEFLMKDLYDKDIVFRFYENANKQPQPGKGAGETIVPSRLQEFSKLNDKKDKAMVDWRKKLDDTWPIPIHVDNHKWKTVKHYCLGSQFKRGFPDFYLEFSLDSESKISQDLDLAMIAGSESGKLESKILRKPEIKVDADYETRKDAERKEALISKFSQNLDLKKMLLATKPARLDHFIRRNKSEADDLLMTVRKEMS